jgi:uncharacterized UPF0160 family protein
MLLFVKILFYFKAVDAVDNGVSQYDLNQSPKYVINTGLASRIKRLNLDWMGSDKSSDAENEAFHRAMALAGGEFVEVSETCLEYAYLISVVECV